MTRTKDCSVDGCIWRARISISRRGFCGYHFKEAREAIAALEATIDAERAENDANIVALRTAREALGDDDKPFLDDAIRALRQRVEAAERNFATEHEALERAWEALNLRLADAQARASRAEAELNTWRQEFTRMLDDGRPYVQDALEAGKELQDATAEARMARQDAERAEAQVERLRLAAQWALDKLGHESWCNACLLDKDRGPCNCDAQILSVALAAEGGEVMTNQTVAGSQATHAWCESCYKIQPMHIEDLSEVSTPQERLRWLGGDVVCDECSFIIATFYAPDILQP